MLIATIGMTSCKSVQFGLAYSVDISGDGDGELEVTFPQGSYAMDGTAKLHLNLGDTLKFNSVEPVTKADVLESGNTKKLAAMKAVNDSIANQFNACAGSGTYDITIQGKVTEIGTGLTFEVNRRLTNREQLRKAPAVNGDVADPYPFIK